MIDDSHLPPQSINTDNSNLNPKKSKDKKKKKKKRGGSKRKMTVEQTLAFKSVSEWVYLGLHPNPSSSVSFSDDFGVQMNVGRGGVDKLVFELHSHSKCSDGYLSPSKLVERAHRNGVKVLALTDHDTLAGVPEAIEAARKFGIKIIPGVEISTIFCPRDSQGEEPVHILAYYSSCGPKSDELEKLLSNIREGRYLRAKNMISKLIKLKLPLEWESVAKIAGTGVAPGRLHVARAMVEAGHVENLRQAFNRYLYDGGPAYSKGSEPMAEDAVKLICSTGGVAVLAHPWGLKNPVPIIRKLKEAGLHGIEVYRNDGKVAVFSDLAETYGLLKLGGADYHGRGGHGESEIGSVNLAVTTLHSFLKVAQPIWCEAIKDIFETYAGDPSDLNLAKIVRYGSKRIFKGSSSYCGKDFIDQCLSLWLTNEERQSIEFDAIRSKLSDVEVDSARLLRLTQWFT